jgi:hypothetical protein
MSDADVLRVMEDLQQSIHDDQLDLTNPDLSFNERAELERRKNSNIRKLEALAKQDLSEKTHADRALFDKLMDEPGLPTCDNCERPIKQGQGELVIGTLRHQNPSDCQS